MGGGGKIIFRRSYIICGNPLILRLELPGIALLELGGHHRFTIGEQAVELNLT
jgi:hypothetical protein